MWHSCVNVLYCIAQAVLQQLELRKETNSSNYPLCRVVHTKDENYNDNYQPSSESVHLDSSDK